MKRINKAIFCGLILGLACGQTAYANPTGATYDPSQVSMATPTPNTLEITNTNGAIINWQQFSIQQNEITRFIQSGANSAVLNRVTGGNPSSILGQLLSNGRVFLINPNGIVFGPNSVIDTAGLIASTLDMTDEDFINQNLKFQGDNAADISNKGYIKAGANGDVFLIAPNIENSGIIETNGGEIILAAGESVTIASLDSDHIVFDVQAPENEVVNLGEMITNGGAAKMFAGTIKHNGSINANSISVDANGNVQLFAKADIEITNDATITANGSSGGEIKIKSDTGTVWSAGTIEAKAEGKGGSVQLLGERVALLDDASIDVSGETGGGEVLIGGDYQGKNDEVKNAKQTYVGEDTTITADAITSGDGGKVIVWADETAQIHGDISAKGGSESGNGGFVETSAKENLQITKTPDVTAPNGQGGEWLIDPNNIDIVAGGGNTNINAVDPFVSTADGAQLGVDLIEAALSGGVSVSVTTAAGGAELGNINLNTILELDDTGGPATNTLTLSAHNDININSAIVDTTPGGQTLNLTLIADSDSSIGGVININADIDTNGGLIDAQSAGAGVISFNAASSTINSNLNATTLNIDGTDNVSFNGTTSTNTLSLTGSGTLNGTGNVIVTGDGTSATDFTWSGSSTVSGVASSGVFLTTGSSVDTNTTTGVTTSLDTSTNNLILDGSSWTNNGTLTWSLISGDSSWRVINASTVNNAGVFNITTGSGANVSQTGGTVGTINNSGILNYSSSGSTTDRLDIHSNFNNTGTLNVNAGFLQIGSSDSSASGISSGSFVVASGAILEFQNDVQTISGTFSGTGSVRIASGTLNLNADNTIADLTMSGGTLQGTGDVTVTTAMSWSGGTFGGTGTLTTNSGVTTTMDGTAATTLDRDWTNNGTIDWTTTSSQDFTINNTLTNTSTGNFNLQNTASAADIVGSGTIDNAGTVTVNFTGGADTDIFPTFNNTGTVTVTQGNLGIFGTGTDTGSYTVASGEILTFSNFVTRDLQAGSSITGAGTVSLGTGTRTFAGTYNITGVTNLNNGSNNFNTTASTNTLIHTAGILGGSGSLTVNNTWTPTSGVTIDGNLITPNTPVSFGTFTIKGSGAITLGGSLTLNSGTTDIDPTLNVTGLTTMNSGSTLDGTNTLFANGGFNVAGFGGTLTWVINRAVQIAGGTWNPSAAGNPATKLLSGTGSITNTGTLNATAGSGFSTFNNRLRVAVPFTNNGIVNKNTSTDRVDFENTFNNNGTINTNDSAKELLLSGGGTHTGTFSGSGFLDLAGGHTFNTGTVFNGSGNVEFSGGTNTFNAGTYNITGQTLLTGGTTTFDASLNSSSLSIGSGTLDGTGNFNISGSTILNNAGTIGGTGILFANGGFNVSGFGGGLTWFVNRDVQMAGGSWNPSHSGNPATKLLSGSGSITNTGTLNVTAGSGFSTFNNRLRVAVAFTNNGIVNKNTSNDQVDFESTFNNNGTVNANDAAKPLRLTGGGTHTGTFNNTAALVFDGGIHNLDDGALLTGGGTYFYTAGNLNAIGTGAGATLDTGATLTVNGGRTLGGAGKLSNNGTLVFNSGSLSADLINNNMVQFTGGTNNINSGSDVSGGGDIAFTGGTTTFAAGSTYTISGDTGINGGDAVFNINAITNSLTHAAGSFGGGSSGDITTSTWMPTSGVTLNDIDLILAANGTNTLTGITVNSAGTATVTNQGSLTVNGSTIASNFTNTGTFNVSGSLNNLSGTATQSAGSFILGAGSDITTANLNVVGGTLTGTGTLNGSVNNSGGTLAAGSSPGTLIIGGNYIQGAGGTFLAELAGTAVAGTDYDLLSVGGTASLAGTLDIQLFGGFNGNVGDQFDIIQSTGAVSGDFTTVTVPTTHTFTNTPLANSYQIEIATVSSGTTTVNATDDIVVLDDFQDQLTVIFVDPDSNEEDEEKKDLACR